MKTRYFKVMNGVIGILGVFFLVVFFTNLIPFVDLGWLPDLGSKTRHANVVRISFLLFFTSSVISYFYFASNRTDFLAVKIYDGLILKRTDILVVALLLVYWGGMTWMSFVRHEALESRAFDLGIFAQAVWTTLHGSFQFSSIKNDICLLGDHVSFGLTFLVPFYALWQDPRMLLVLQSASTASLIWLIYRIAGKQIQHRGIAFFFALSFFLFMPSRNVLRDDFHPEVLAEPFMLLAFLFLNENKTRLFLICLAVVVSMKENLSGISFIFGVYCYFVKQRRALGFFISLFSVLYLLLAVKWLVPTVSGEPYLYQGFYRSLFTAPLEVFAKIFDPEVFGYLAKMFSPVLFLSLFNPSTLIFTLPILIQNIMSSNRVTLSLNYHYTVGLTPFVFLSAIYGFASLQRRYVYFFRFRVHVAILLIAVGVLRYGPSEYFHIWKSKKNITVHTQAIRKYMNSLPEGRVLTHNNLIPQAVQRKYIYQFDYLPTPTKAEQVRQLNPDWVILNDDFMEPSTGDIRENVREILSLGYEIDYQRDGFVSLKKTLP